MVVAKLIQKLPRLFGSGSSVMCSQEQATRLRPKTNKSGPKSQLISLIFVLKYPPTSAFLPLFQSVRIETPIYLYLARCVLYVPPISSSLQCNFLQPLLLPLSQVKLFSLAPCSHNPSICVIPLIPVKTRSKLKTCSTEVNNRPNVFFK